MQILNFIKTEFLLIGGHATSLYMPQRQTFDIDILIHQENQEEINQEFIAENARLIGDLTIGGRSYLLQEQTINIIYSKDSWFFDAYRAANVAFGIKVISLPYLVLLKMLAGRMQDLADCSRMLGHADNSTIAEVKRIITLYSPEDLEDLESLIYLGKIETNSL